MKNINNSTKEISSIAFFIKTFLYTICACVIIHITFLSTYAFAMAEEKEVKEYIGDREDVKGDNFYRKRRKVSVEDVNILSRILAGQNVGAENSVLFQAIMDMQDFLGILGAKGGMKEHISITELYRFFWNTREYYNFLQKKQAYSTIQSDKNRKIKVDKILPEVLLKHIRPLAVEGRDSSIYYLRGANLSGIKISNLSFDFWDLRDVDFTSTTFNNVSFIGADLRGANFKDTKGINTIKTFGADLRDIKNASVELLNLQKNAK